MSVAEAELLYEAPCERREGARGRTLRRAPHRGSLAPEGGARGGGERVGGRAHAARLSAERPPVLILAAGRRGDDRPRALAHRERASRSIRISLCQ